MKGDHTRHWAIWRMMTQLREWSEFNEGRIDLASAVP